MINVARASAAAEPPAEFLRPILSNENDARSSSKFTRKPPPRRHPAGGPQVVLVVPRDHVVNRCTGRSLHWLSTKAGYSAAETMGEIACPRPRASADFKDKQILSSHCDLAASLALEGGDDERIKSSMVVDAFARRRGLGRTREQGLGRPTSRA